MNLIEIAHSKHNLSQENIPRTSEYHRIKSTNNGWDKDKQWTMATKTATQKTVRKEFEGKFERKKHKLKVTKCNLQDDS